MFGQENLDNYFTTCMEFCDGNYTKVLTNLSYLELNGELARCIALLNQNKLNEAVVVVHSLIENFGTEEAKNNEHRDFVIASCLSSIGETLVSAKCNTDLKGAKTTSFIEVINAYTLTIKSQFTKNYFIFDSTPLESMNSTKGKLLNYNM